MQVSHISNLMISRLDKKDTGAISGLIQRLCTGGLLGESGVALITPAFFEEGVTARFTLLLISSVPGGVLQNNHAAILQQP